MNTMKNISAKWRLVASAGALTLSAASASAEPVKLGVFLALSGPTSGAGELYRTAISSEIKAFNAAGGWHGEPIEIKFYDDGGTTQGETDRFKQAIADGVHVIAQGGASAVAAALSSDVRRWNERNPDKPVAMLIMGSEAADFTGKDCHYYSFRLATTAAIRVNALAKVMTGKEVLGKRIYAINQDYSWGREMEAAVKKNAATYKYEVAGSILHDFNKIQDFSPYVERIRSAKPDTVFTGNWGRDLLLLMQATEAGGLQTKFATVYLDEPGSLASAGKSALGSYVAQVFNAEAAGEAGEKYSKQYHAATGTYPASFANNGVIGMRMLTAGLKNLAKSPKVDVTKLVLALEQAEAEWPLGTLKMRSSDHQLILPLVVSVVSQDAATKEDGTDMGFKPVAVLKGADAEVPSSDACQMKRPG